MESKQSVFPAAYSQLGVGDVVLKADSGLGFPATQGRSGDIGSVVGEARPRGQSSHPSIHPRAPKKTHGGLRHAVGKSVNKGCVTRNNLHGL